MKFHRIKLARLGIFLGTEIFLIAGIAMMFYGKLNMDESWYLYASKLAYRGMLPYRDFAFTQMPLLPYVYGMTQLLFGQSLLVGRATSFGLSILSFFLALKVAHRYSGEAAAGLTAIFLGTFFFGIYFLTIVKTYALVTFFFMLVFFFLSTELSDLKRLSLAIVCATLAGITRLSAMPFAILILIYVLWAPFSKGIRFLALGVFLLLLLPTALIFAADPRAAGWNLWTYHALLWKDVTLAEKITSMLLVRPLALISSESSYTFYFLLLFLFILLVSQQAPLLERLKTYILRHHEILAMAAGIFLFAISHFQNGSWYLEYFVPAMFIGIVILCVGCVKIYLRLQAQRAAQTLIAGVIGLSLLIFLLQQPTNLLEFEHGETVLAGTRHIAEYVSSFTEPDDSIIVLEALWVAIESQRDVMPGYTLAQFSYWPFLDEEEAQRLKLVNLEILQENILSGQAKAVVLTNIDWNIIGSEPMKTVCYALHQNYSLGLTIDQSETYQNRIYVYRRDIDSSLKDDPVSDPCARY